MDDETFDRFIIMDGGEDCEKENVATNHSRQPKTTQKQFDLIVEFMKSENLIFTLEMSWHCFGYVSSSKILSLFFGQVITKS